MLTKYLLFFLLIYVYLCQNTQQGSQSHPIVNENFKSCVHKIKHAIIIVENEYHKLQKWKDRFQNIEIEIYKKCSNSFPEGLDALVKSFNENYKIGIKCAHDHLKKALETESDAMKRIAVYKYAVEKEVAKYPENAGVWSRKIGLKQRMENPNQSKLSRSEENGILKLRKEERKGHKRKRKRRKKKRRGRRRYRNHKGNRNERSLKSKRYIFWDTPSCDETNTRLFMHCGPQMHTHTNLMEFLNRIAERSDRFTQSIVSKIYLRKQYIKECWNEELVKTDINNLKVLYHCYQLPRPRPTSPLLVTVTTPYSVPDTTPHSVPVTTSNSPTQTNPNSIPDNTSENVDIIEDSNLDIITQPITTTPYSAPDTIPYPPPDTTPHSAPDTTPNSPPDPTPYSPPDTSPHSAPDTTPYSPPDTTPYSPPDTTPYSSPDSTSNSPTQTNPNSIPDNTTENVDITEDSNFDTTTTQPITELVIDSTSAKRFNITYEPDINF